MQTHNLGYPRIGSQRELKKASEQYWSGKLPADQLMNVGKNIRLQNWQLQKDAGIDLIPCNDFSFYDQVLDTSLMVGAIPQRYHTLMEEKQLPDIDLLFAMARGYQKDGYDLTAMEMTNGSIRIIIISSRNLLPIKNLRPSPTRRSTNLSKQNRPVLMPSRYSWAPYLTCYWVRRRKKAFTGSN